MSAIQFNTTQFDKKHLRSLATRRKKLQALYNAFYNQVAVIGATTGFNDPDKEFFLRDYPAAQQAIQALLQQLCRDITTNIKEGNAAAWSASNAKNSALIAALGVQKATADTLLTRVTKRSESAFNAFQGRKVNGMGLSERVWALQKGVMPQIEMALELGLAQGKSAAALSRDVRSYLNEPNRLFRRVRGKDGILRLSKAAAAYHPGQGVYRSSYKNALRMTVTENNMAYRSADHAQWGGMDFVIGIEISLSGNHPVVDICDELKGKYPKEFKFTGWHPFCRCFATPILPSREEMNKWARMSDAERAGYRFNGEVDKMPKEFNKWLNDNAERISRAKSMPYFIKDNINVSRFERFGSREGVLNFIPSLRVKHPLNNYVIQAYGTISDNSKRVTETLGISLSKPMPFKVADSGHVNPKYSWFSKIDYTDGYGNNCVVATDVLELRLRGIDVKAGAAVRQNKYIWECYTTGDLCSIWIDPKTKRKPIPEFIHASTKELLVDKLEESMQKGGRYKIGVRFEDGNGHAFSAFKDNEGRVFYYDAQCNEINYKSWQKKINIKKDLQVLRIDDKIVNLEDVPKIIDKS